ncbi:hypothetical protein SDJN02_15568 [Cucurbita argyrosperma subsp. argyrosperma]|nr:hypothetical protein SDJN02_15568 [Cucurbita argyrosperma subsp. argyrosperma]
MCYPHDLRPWLVSRRELLGVQSNWVLLQAASAAGSSSNGGGSAKVRCLCSPTGHPGIKKWVLNIQWVTHKQVKGIVNDLNSIQIHSGIHIRRPSSGNSTAVGADKSKSSSSVANGNAKVIVIEREEVLIANPNRSRDGKVKDENRQQTDFGVVEFQSDELERGIGGEE